MTERPGSFKRETPGPHYGQHGPAPAGRRRACYLGNHSDCTASTCRCPCHGPGRQNERPVTGHRDVVACVYFALCDRPADGIVEVGFHPWTIPTCERCARQVGAELVPGTFVIDADGTGAAFTPSEPR